MFDTSFIKPIKSELHKKYIENIALSILKHVFPNEFSQFEVYDKPDLQDRESSIGIEVVEAKSQQIAQVEGEFVKMQFGKKSKEKMFECKQKIETNGGKISEKALFYPVRTAEDEISLFQNAMRKKMKLLPSYYNEGSRKWDCLCYIMSLLSHLILHI